MITCHRLLAIACLALLAGCCPCPQRNILPLPAPITLEEQSRHLTEWSHQLPLIKARTVTAGVRLDYRDDKGQDHSVNAEGLLQIRQHPTDSQDAAAPAADVLLLGTAFDQPAFEAGRNAKDWWFAIKLDTKKAWMGDSTRPVNFAAMGGEGSASILRADLVPDLLGLALLPPAKQIFGDAVSPLRLLLMLVNDAEASNHLLIVYRKNTGMFASQAMTMTELFVEREIIVDRRSGHVTEVRLYNTQGVVAVRSQLSDYTPVSYADGVEKPTVVPEFPKKVVVSYPGQFLTVALEFDTVTVVGEFKPAVFTTPKFGEQGLRVIPVE